MTVSLIGRRTFYVAAGLAIALGPAAVTASSSDAPAPRSTATCENVETQDSFSMNCAPSVIPDTSDQLTEQEVAEPGFNGGGSGGGNKGGR